MEQVPSRKTFLILEDDANDALLIRRAFTNAACRAFVCRNTSEARAYLQGAGMYGNRERFPFPELFVTDLKLGEESGMQFVSWLRSTEEFKDLPVVVLSGMVGREDVQSFRKLGVSKILQKPGNPFDLECLLLKLSEQLCPVRRETLKFTVEKVLEAR